MSLVEALSSASVAVRACVSGDRRAVPASTLAALGRLPPPGVGGGGRLVAAARCCCSRSRRAPRFPPAPGPAGPPMPRKRLSMVSRSFVCTFSSRGWITAHSSSLALSCVLMRSFMRWRNAPGPRRRATGAGGVWRGQPRRCGGGGGGGASSCAKAWVVPASRRPAVVAARTVEVRRFHEMDLGGWCVGCRFRRPSGAAAVVRYLCNLDRSLLSPYSRRRGKLLRLR